MILTKRQARQFILAYQNLLPPRIIYGKEEIYKYIKKVGCIQYDPLNMVGYNPYLVLQSRVKDFKPQQLQKLLYSERKLLDGWDKNMSIYTVEDWPYFKRYREQAYEKYNLNESIKKVLPEIREIIEEKGPISSSDIALDTKIDWSWAPTRVSRAVLESMYFWGELIIHHKVGTRKFYDFTKKYIPQTILSMPDTNRTIEQYFEWYVKRRIQAVGLLWNRSGDAWLGIRWMKSKERNEAIMSLVEKDELIPITVNDIKYPFYVHKEDKLLLNEIIQGTKEQHQVSFIAPLDNMMWDRKLIKELFKYEYKWEVYTPVSKRKYGYYVLPVLFGDKFIARFEPKYNQKSRLLEIINWWWEPNIVITEEIKTEIACCLNDFLRYLGARDINVICDDNTIRGIVKEVS